MPDIVGDALKTVHTTTYTTAQVAALAQVSLRTAKRMAAARKIPGAVRFGRSLRFARKAVDAWLAGH